MEKMSESPLKEAVGCAGGIRPVSEACGVTYESVRRWVNVHKSLPRTEWTGETSYAKTICELGKFKFQPDDLLHQVRRKATESAA